MSEITDKIKQCYRVRGLKWPNEMQALAWVNTELAECYELLLARDGGWVRNNPEDKEGWSEERWAEELGDTIFMLLVAGIVSGVDPLQSMLSKIDKAIDKEIDSCWLSIEDIVPTDGMTAIVETRNFAELDKADIIMFSKGFGIGQRYVRDGKITVTHYVYWEGLHE